MVPDITGLVKLFEKSRGTIVLTGAGVSTASGIPDFRTPVTGLWQRLDPSLLSAEALFADPSNFYHHCLAVFEPILKAEPNQAHLTLAKLEKKGFLSAIITQNIDGLHQKAGSQKVIEVHGHLRTAHCINCQRHVPLEHLFEEIRQDRVPPPCNHCGGSLRPDVVLFGDGLTPDFAQAQILVEEADLLLVIGSSLEVAPVNSLPLLASKLAIINLMPTPYDHMAEVVLRGDASSILESLAAGLQVY